MSGGQTELPRSDSWTAAQWQIDQIFRLAQAGGKEIFALNGPSSNVDGKTSREPEKDYLRNEVTTTNL